MKISVKNKEKTYALLFKGKKIPLHDSITFGSKEGYWDLNDEEISSEHCTIEQIGDCLTVLDHHSLYGTYLAEEKIIPGQKLFLVEGDYLRLGKNIIQIQAQEKGVNSFSSFQSFQSPSPSFEELTPLFYRWLSLILDLVFAFILKDFIQWPQIILDFLPHFYQRDFLLTFISVQLLSSLFLNTTLFQAYLKCYSSSSWPWGFFRTFIGLITLPFLIFDLPLIWKNKSFKESLTCSLMSKKDVPLGRILLVFPVLVLIFYSYPLWKGGEIVVGENIFVTQRVKKEQLGERSFFVKNFQLAFYHPDFILYPIFKETEDKKIEAILKIIKNSQEIELTLKKKINLKNTLKDIALIPFFLKSYEKNFFYFKEDFFETNFAKTLETSFRLGFEEAFLSFQDFFPYYLHRLQFRKKILEILEEERLQEPQIILLGHNYYLMYKKNDFYRILSLNKDYTYLYEVKAESLESIQEIYKFIKIGDFQDYFIAIDYFFDKDLNIRELYDYLKEIKIKMNLLSFEALKSQLILLLREKRIDFLEDEVKKI